MMRLDGGLCHALPRSFRAWRRGSPECRQLLVRALRRAAVGLSVRGGWGGGGVLFVGRHQLARGLHLLIQAAAHRVTRARLLGGSCHLS